MILQITPARHRSQAVMYPRWLSEPRTGRSQELGAELGGEEPSLAGTQAARIARSKRDSWLGVYHLTRWTVAASDLGRSCRRLKQGA